MKSTFRTKYGTSKVLTIQEVETPFPAENQILIKVHACTVNRSDCHILTGKPVLMRLFTGLFKPKISTTGTDFAGEIESTGKLVQSFKPGQRVMGFSGGLKGLRSHAQYILLSEKLAGKIMVTIPEHLDYTESAACLEGALYAAGVTKLNLKAGQNALVYGATGAIGSSYLQYLKDFGLNVTAVCKEEHTALVKSLGANRVIDYTKEDFTRDTERYDYVLDAVGKLSFMQCKHLLKKKGIYMSSGGAENILLIMITPLFRGKKVVFKTFMRVKPALEFIKEFIEKGKFKPVIDRYYPLDEIAKAFDYVASGQKIGNVIIKMDH